MCRGSDRHDIMHELVVRACAMHPLARRLRRLWLRLLRVIVAVMYAMLQAPIPTPAPIACRTVLKVVASLLLIVRCGMRGCESCVRVREIFALLDDFALLHDSRKGHGRVVSDHAIQRRIGEVSNHATQRRV